MSKLRDIQFSDAVYERRIKNIPEVAEHPLPDPNMERLLLAEGGKIDVINTWTPGERETFVATVGGITHHAHTMTEAINGVLELLDAARLDSQAKLLREIE